MSITQHKYSDVFKSLRDFSNFVKKVNGACRNLYVTTYFMKPDTILNLIAIVDLSLYDSKIPHCKGLALPTILQWFKQCFCKHARKGQLLRYTIFPVIIMYPYSTKYNGTNDIQYNNDMLLEGVYKQKYLNTPVNRTKMACQ